MSDSVVPQKGLSAPVEPVLALEAVPAVTKGRRSPLARGLLWVLVALAAYKLIPIYYCYLDLKVSCAQVLREAEIESDEEIRLRMVEALERHGIAVSARDIQIRRGEGRISIVAPYEEHIQLNFLGAPVRLFSFSFSPSAERVYK